MESRVQSQEVAFLDCLAARSRQAIFAYQPASGQLSYLNAAFEQLVERSAAQLQAHPAGLLERVHPDDRSYLEQAFQQLCRGQDQGDLEFRLRQADGSFRWICLSGYCLQEAGQPLTLAGDARDITLDKQHRQVERQLTAQKNSLLEILSHDLSGPMVNIQALASYSRKLVREDQGADLEQLMGLIERTAQRNVHLIRTFVEGESLQFEQVGLRKERIEVVERVRYPIEQLQGSQANMGKTFHLLHSHPTVYLAVDEVKFLQIITNLLSNAIKFTGEQGVITTRLEKQLAHVLISVADDGIGIPPRYQDRVFDRFTKAKRPGLRGEESHGLGLSIVKALVELHGGRIWLESEQGRGTTFFVQLPKS